MEKTSIDRKAPNRSRISDRELAEKIRRERSERPTEFVYSSCASSNPKKTFCTSSAVEVIAKWL